MVEEIRLDTQDFLKKTGIYNSNTPLLERIFVGLENIHVVLDGNPTVRSRYIQAKSETLSTADASDLKDDSLILIRGALAQNTLCPQETLSELACDVSPHVRMAVCRNPATSEPILHTLIFDDVKWIRNVLLMHPNCSDYINALVGFQNRLAS